MKKWWLKWKPHQEHNAACRVQTYRRRIVEGQLCSNSTTWLTWVDGQNLDVRKVALKRRLLWQLCKSGQPRDEQQHPRQKMSRISHLPFQVPQGDSQEEIILTAWVGAQRRPTTKEATRPTFPVWHGQEDTKSINKRSKQQRTPSRASTTNG
jgi:hypothetical protein